VRVLDWSLEAFLEKAASSEPTPGGGSVAAYTGALAASMVCMVANLTIGKKGYEPVEAQAQAILAEASASLTTLKNGVERDMKIFGSFMDAWKMPRESEEQKTLRTELMQKIYREATDSPMEIAREAVTVLQLAHCLAPIGNKGAISDVGVAANLAESALKAAIWSVDINLPALKDIGYVEQVCTQCTAWVSLARRLGAETAAAVRGRIS